MNREEMISYLVDRDYGDITGGRAGWLLDSYLRNGFKGYANFTDEELRAEFDEDG